MKEQMKHPFKKTMILLAVLSFGLLPAIASTPLVKDTKKDSPDQREARVEGMLWTLYAVNEHLHDDPIWVEVNDEKAVLIGHVDNDLERSLAKQLALGLKEIDSVDNQLKLDPTVKNSEKTAGLLGLLDNASKTAAIKTKLMWNKDIAGTKIDVDTTGNVVVLSGTAPTEAAALKAVELAKDTTGVDEVKNQLKVVNDGPTTQQKVNTRLNEVGSDISDAWIASATKATLLYSNKIQGNDIGVSCEEGVVHLKGKVPTDLHRDLAVAMTNNIVGVKDVDATKLKTQ